MERGQLVQVTQYGGSKLVRRVVADLGGSIVICNESEYRQARKERRRPDGVGFPREAVEVVPETQCGA